MNQKAKLTVILEKDDGYLWGRVEYDPVDKPGFLHTTEGSSVEEITKNLRELISDSLKHELKDDPAFAGITANDIEFDYAYDLSAFFEIFDALKINTIAELAGLNKALVRQYVSGVKNPSRTQAERIEQAVHELGKKLLQVQFA
jgi:hypothetical protein